MQLGKVIRKYRKEKNMTQEEMAVRLGVTAPAVNKWENGNSCPDITLLAPIARLLGITTDTLLSYRETLAVEEIQKIVSTVDSMFKEKAFEEVFQWAKETLQQYPNCEQLIWQVAVTLNAQCLEQEPPDAERYEEYICSLYKRVLESQDEQIRSEAADSLFVYYMRKKQYDQAEKYLEYFSVQNPERKRKQAQLYSETGRIQEAYKAYEEILFADYQIVCAVLQGMYALSVQEQDMERAHMLVRKQKEAAGLYDMGKYYEASAGLEIAIMEKDADTVIAIMQEMLSSVEQISSFCRAPLYEHMEFKEARPEFVTELKNNLLKCFCDEESFGFLKDDKRWQELKALQK